MWAHLQKKPEIAAATLFLFIFYNSLSIANEAPFERVFHSSEDRRELDQVRARQAKSDVLHDQSVTNSKSNPTLITVSGILRRNDGKNVVWINGASKLSVTPPSKNIKTYPLKNQKSKAFISTPGSSKTLKAGQVWEVETNKVFESYQNKLPPKKENMTNATQIENTTKELDTVLETLSEIKSKIPD